MKSVCLSDTHGRHSLVTAPPLNLLEPVCGYAGGKRRLAPVICDHLLATNPARLFDLCCGSGAITLELVNRGIEPTRITSVDTGPWGWFWEQVGAGTFPLDAFVALWGQMPSDPRDVARWVQEEVATMPPTTVTFLILQAASFGSTPVWWDGQTWRRGEGNRKYRPRSFWEPGPSSKETKPRGTIFQPDQIPARVEAIVRRLRGLDGRHCRAEDVSFPAAQAVIYIDPPYRGTSGYGAAVDWLGIAQAVAVPVYVSEGVPLPEAAQHIPLGVRKGASLNGGSDRVASEWLNLLPVRCFDLYPREG